MTRYARLSSNDCRASIEARAMTDEPDSQLERDGRFPSGAWTGFFLQGPSTARHRMELRLTFRSGTLRGDGHDWVGAFTMDGHYDLGDGRCWWTKRYVGKHVVTYAGHNEGRGIWGVWEIQSADRGGFHIWPAGMGDPTREALTEAEEAPVEAVGGTLASPGAVATITLRSGSSALAVRALAGKHRAHLRRELRHACAVLLIGGRIHVALVDKVLQCGIVPPGGNGSRSQCGHLSCPTHE
jgi:hypothetical protein